MLANLEDVMSCSRCIGQCRLPECPDIKLTGTTGLEAKSRTAAMRVGQAGELARQTALMALSTSRMADSCSET